MSDRPTRLRVGHHVPRNLYEHPVDQPSDSKSGTDVGRVDSAELAAEIVRSVNTLRDAAVGGEYDPRTEVDAHWGGDPERIVSAWEADRAELRAALEQARADLDAATHFLIGGVRVGYREIRGVWQVWGDAAHGGYERLPEPENHPDRDAALARARQLAGEVT